MAVFFVRQVVVLLLLSCLLRRVGQVNLRLKSVSVSDILFILDIINSDVVVIVVVVIDCALPVAIILGDLPCFFVSLVAGASDDDFVVIFLLVRLSISKSVFAEHDTLAEDFVVPGTAEAIVWFFGEVREAWSMVSLIRIAVRTQAPLVIVAAVGAVAGLLGALVVRFSRPIPASIAAKSVVTTIAEATAVSIGSSISVATELIISATVLIHRAQLFHTI